MNRRGKKEEKTRRKKGTHEQTRETYLRIYRILVCVRAARGRNSLARYPPPLVIPRNSACFEIASRCIPRSARYFLVGLIDGAGRRSARTHRRARARRRTVPRYARIFRETISARGALFRNGKKREKGGKKKRRKESGYR